MPWDEGLNDEQRLAASHIGSHACLLAGPGTGKTRCLTHRILYLVNVQNISPTSIIALTFTRAAAAELRTRVQSELDENVDLPHISTLHSFALRTLLSQFSGSNLPQPIRIADDFEERYIIQEELKSILDIREIGEVQELLHKLSSNWEQLTADESDWETRFPNPRFLGAWQEHREVYGYILRSELVYQLKHALDEENVQLPNQISHILVDEYQDLNACDLATISNITSSNVELYAAGDDDQSIYGFRYANPEGIRQFSQHYQPSTPLNLSICMRCDRNILDFATYIASTDPRRPDRNLVCRHDAEDGEVNILRFRNQSVEADAIAELCNWLINDKNISPNEILILLRSDRNSKFSKPIRTALEQLDIKVLTVANPLAVLDTIEGRHFFCILKLVDYERDNLAWRTLLEIRSNNIGQSTINAIYDLARTQGKTFYEVLSDIYNDPSLIPHRVSILRNEIENIRSIISNISEDDSSDLTSLIESISNEQIEDENIRSEILNLFLRVLEQGAYENLNQLLRAINVSLNNNEQDKDNDSINIMTMHQAKGLDADAVFIVAAEDEYIPGRASGERIEDERRLLYVSLTRARHFLYITHCQRRTGEQRHSGSTSGNQRRTLSRFLSGGTITSQSGSEYIDSL
jgi:DNA helicase-2/ATP-dependent DNA helicase PcrA